MNEKSDCSLLRKTLKEASKALFKEEAVTETSHLGSFKRGCVQVLPIMWRQKLNFGLSKAEAQENENMDSNQATLDDITLDTVPSIRMIVSDVILDVLLYMTPRYRQEMIIHISDELNRIYALYKQRNPNFKGRVSIFGHSLGSLLAFDILSHQKTSDFMPSKSKNVSREIDLSDLLNSPDGGPFRWNGMIDKTTLIQFKKLDFDVHSLFGKSFLACFIFKDFGLMNIIAVGSPIGLFLLLKGDRIHIGNGGECKHGIDPAGVQTSCPAVDRIYNVFHPHDPVAYRIEPLIDKRYSKLKPFQILYTKGGLKGTIAGITDMTDTFVEKTQTIVSGIVNSMSISWFSSTTRSVSPSRVTESGEGKNQIELQDVGRGTEEKQQPEESRNVSPVKKASSVEEKEIPPKTIIEEESFHPSVRYDFSMQEGIMENPYLSALGVHMNYWSDQDCAAFVLRQLYNIKDDRRSSIGRVNAE